MPVTQKNMTITPIFLLILVLLPLALAVIVLLSIKTPNVQFVAPNMDTLTSAPTVTPTIIPAHIALIAPFTPSFACELQNEVVIAHCRSEWVEERMLAQGEGVIFIKRSEHAGWGCWSGISVDLHKLNVCNMQTGAITTIGQNLITPLQRAPDGSRYAFAVMKHPLSADDSFTPDVYVVSGDGQTVQQLDVGTMPERGYGASHLRWSDDGEWVEFEMWDGTQPEGWHPYRLKADGSGILEPLTARIATYTPEPTPTWVESPTASIGFTPDGFAPFPSSTPASLTPASLPTPSR